MPKTIYDNWKESTIPLDSIEMIDEETLNSEEFKMECKENEATDEMWEEVFGGD